MKITLEVDIPGDVEISSGDESMLHVEYDIWEGRGSAYILKSDIVLTDPLKVKRVGMKP